MPKTSKANIAYCLRHKVIVGLPEKHAKCPTRWAPSMSTLMRWEFDSVAYTPCGCKVEPDGRCRHGHGSWLVVMGVL